MPFKWAVDKNLQKQRLVSLPRLRKDTEIGLFFTQKVLSISAQRSKLILTCCNGRRPSILYQLGKELVTVIIICKVGKYNNQFPHFCKLLLFESEDLVELQVPDQAYGYELDYSATQIYT